MKLFTESLAESHPDKKPFIHNNLGMANFFNFAAQSRQITDPNGVGLDALKQLLI